MDSQMQARFLNHIFKFFSVKSNEEGAAAGAADVDAHGGAVGQDGLIGAAATSSNSKQAAVVSATATPDVAELLGVLRTAGFFLQYSDKSESWGSTVGCRVIITCKRSGTRVVLDSEGSCTCPSEDAMKTLLDASRTETAASQAPPSPTPSTCAMLEDSAFNSTVRQEAKPRTRQRTSTFSLTDEAQGQLAPENRRLSAPPAPMQSAWTTFQGDELNVLAATDLLQEAMSLLSGVKKVDLRNTPVGPMRRRSAVGATGPSTGRRSSSDVFAMPLRPLSRTSSTSSGLASIMSSGSGQSSQADTPRPVKPAMLAKPAKPAPASGSSQIATLRRTISAAGSLVRPSPSTTVRPKQATGMKGLAEESKSSSKFVSRMPSLLKAPSVGNRASACSPRKVRKDTSSSYSTARITPQVSKPSNIPDAESTML